MITREEYIKRIQEASEEEESSDWIKTGKHMLKHMVAATPASVGTAYLTGGGEAVPAGALGGLITGIATSLATDDDDDSIVAPVGAALGVGSAIGGKHVIDNQARKIQEMKKNGYNYSEIEDFFSSYTEEGRKDFANKLKNFAVLGTIGALDGYVSAPPGEEREYATRSAFGANIGSTIVGAPAMVGGAAAGGILGGVFGDVPNKHKNLILRKGSNLKSRIGNTISGAVFGGTSAGLLGAAFGGREGSRLSIEELKRNKRKEMLAKRLMIESLTDKEKAQIGRLIRKKRKEKGMRMAEDYVKHINSYSFSSNKNLVNMSVASELGKLTLKEFLELFPEAAKKGNVIKNAEKKGFKIVEDTPPRSSTVADLTGSVVNSTAVKIGAGAAAVAALGSTDTGVKGVMRRAWGGESYERELQEKAALEAFEAQERKKRNEKMAADVKEFAKDKGAAIIGGGLLGATIGGNSDPVLSGAVGAGLGGVGHHLAKSGILGDSLKDNSGAQLAVGLGASALGSFILSKFNKDKNKKEDKKKKKKNKKSFFEPEVKGPGRPKKSDVEEDLSEEDLKAFNSMFK